MLMRVDEKVVIKADRYCFQVCEYRGMTRFPGGVTPYSKPNKYCSHLFEMTDVIIGQNGHLSSELIEAMRADYRLWKWLCEVDISDEAGKTKWFNSRIKFDKDCYMVKTGSDYSTYHPKLGQALYHCWAVYTREHGKFGGERTEFMKNYNDATKEEVDEFLKNYEKHYANPLVIVEEADKFKDAICEKYGVEFTFDGKYRKDLELVDNEVASGKK